MTTEQLPAVITGKFNIALTQTQFQKLADKASSLIYNEDNLTEISGFLEGLRAVKKAIAQTHKDGKAEALKIGQQWDSAKRSFEETVSAIELKPQTEYTRLCQEVQKRKYEQEQERTRIQTIKTGIETNAISFAKTISECSTSEQLTNVERIINLEKSRKEKYQEFLPEASARFSELNALLKTQKETVRELEENERKQEIAKKANDDAALLELKEKKEVAQAKMEETQTVVQETAIMQSLKEEVPVAQEVLPEVKARRSSWEWEVSDIRETNKKMPEWVKLTPFEEKINEYLKAKKAEGITGEEFTFAGIRFYLKKTF